MRNIIDKHKDIENKIKILENTLEDFNDVEFRNKMIVEIKKKHEENVIIREEKQEPLKKFLERHTKLLEAKKEDPVIYFIAEYERVFTSEENSYNLLYIGETTRWSHRQKSYNDLDSNSNELIDKLIKKLTFEDDGQIKINDTWGTPGTKTANKDNKERVEKVKELLKNNLRIFILKRKRYHDSHKRVYDEGIFINKFRPLLNVGHTQHSAKRESIRKDLMSLFPEEELEQFIREYHTEEKDCNKNIPRLIRTGKPSISEDRVEKWFQHINFIKLVEKGFVKKEDITLEKINQVLSKTIDDNMISALISKELGLKTSVVNCILEDLCQIFPLTKTSAFKYKALKGSQRIFRDVICGRDIVEALKTNHSYLFSGQVTKKEYVFDDLFRELGVIK